MQSIKIEIDTVCRGCLSIDREVTLLNENVTLFFFLLNESFNHNNSIYFNINLCWECTALLRRVAKFKRQLKKSRDIFMKKCLENQLIQIETLSKLNSSSKNNYDFVIEHNDPEMKIEQTETDVVIPDFTHFMANNDNVPRFRDNNEDASHYHDDNVEISHFSVRIIKEESCDSYDNDPEYQPPVQKYKTEKNLKLSSRNEVKVVAAVYDESVTDRYISEVCLSVKDLEALKRDKRGKIKVLSDSASTAAKNMLEKMQQDILQTDDSTPTCSECEKALPNSTAIVKHWESHMIKLYKCKYCSYHDYHENMMTHLQQRHNKIYICKCGLEYGNINQYYKHYRNLHKRFDCDDCKRKYNSKESIEKHMLHNHLPLICEICNKKYKSFRKLKTHHLIYHQEKEGKNEKPYCVECDRRFNNEYLYKRHLRTSVAHRPKTDVKVPCPDCGKIFSRKTYMMNHYNLIHVRQSKHYCEICDKYFVTGYAIRTHKKFVHDKLEKPKDKICEICGKGFYTNRVLINHKRTHTGERPHKCSYCPAAFTQQYSMKTHERTQHKKYINS